MSANRVAAINPPIDDTDPIRKFSIDPGSHTDWQKQAEFSLQKGSRYGISVSTPHRRYGHRLRTPFLRTPFPRLLENVCLPEFADSFKTFGPRDSCKWQIGSQTKRAHAKGVTLSEQAWFLCLRSAFSNALSSQNPF